MQTKITAMSREITGVLNCEEFSKYDFGLNFPVKRILLKIVLCWMRNDFCEAVGQKILAEIWTCERMCNEQYLSRQITTWQSVWILKLWRLTNRIAAVVTGCTSLNLGTWTFLGEGEPLPGSSSLKATEIPRVIEETEKFCFIIKCTNNILCCNVYICAAVKIISVVLVLIWHTSTQWILMELILWNNQEVACFLI